MLNHLKKLSSQTLIYGLGDAVTRLAGLLLLPIYTRFLSPDDYGKLAIAMLFSMVVALVLEFGQRTAFFRFYFENENAEDRRRLTGTVLIFLLFSAALILTPLILFFDRLGLILIKDATLVPLVRIALVGTFFDVGSTIPFAIFRAKQYAARYAALSLSRFLISVVLNIVAIVVLRWGVAGLIYANLVTSVLFFVVCLVLTVRDIEWKVDFSLLKRLLRYGSPLIPAGLAYWALNLSDRFFLQKYRDLGEVGVYTLAYSIAAILHMIMGWFNTAYAPYCYSIAKDADARSVYARVMTYSMTLLTFMGLGLSLFAREALNILTPPSFHRAAVIVPFIVLSYLFYELYYFLSFGLDLTNKTAFAPLITGAGAIINLTLNLILIRPFGMMGAAVATLLSYVLLPVIEYPIVRRIYPIPYEWGRLLKLLLVSVTIYLAGAMLKTGQLWIDLGVGAALILAWGLILYWWRFFPRNELLAAHAASRRVLRIFKKGNQVTVSKAS